MSALADAVACYLATRRALGFKLEGAGQLLEQFAAFGEAAGADTVTIELALTWATLPAGRSRAWHAQRLSAVRGFARWLHAIDPRAQIPSAGLLPGGTRRAVPYLYSEVDITALIDAAGGLNPPWKALTMQTLTGLLFTTGVRLGEALSLDHGDLDPAAGMLTIRQAKFRKPRQLPLHPRPPPRWPATPPAAARCAHGQPRQLSSYPPPVPAWPAPPSRRPSGAC
jgi:integrase/recombinase XerD